MRVALKALFGKLNETTRQALEGAAGLCLVRTHYDVEVEHFLLKLLDPDNDVGRIAQRFAIDIAQLQRDLERSLDKFKTGNTRTPALSPLLVDLVTDAWVIASLEFAADRIRSGAVLVALLRQAGSSPQILAMSNQLGGISVETLAHEFSAIVSGSSEAERMPTAVSNVPFETGAGPRVFICYRRHETEAVAQTLFYCLMAKVDGVRLFRDTDTLQPGMVFAEVIDQTIAGCDALVAVIGKKWLTLKGANGLRRLDDEADWVRMEISSALRQKKRIIPCLANGARMPSADELPTDLRPLTSYHPVAVSQISLDRDVEPLIRSLLNIGAPHREHTVRPE